MKDYHDYHVLLLADVFEKFRKDNLNNYGLCPSHYLNASSLNWDAMFKMIKIELEFIPNPAMFIFFEKVQEINSYISNRYSKANNKYLKFYEPKEKSKHMLYIKLI